MNLECDLTAGVGQISNARQRRLAAIEADTFPASGLPTAGDVWPVLLAAQFDPGSLPGWGGPLGLLGRLAHLAETAYAHRAMATLIDDHLRRLCPDTDDWTGVAIKLEHARDELVLRWADQTARYATLATQTLYAAADGTEPSPDGYLPGGLPAGGVDPVRCSVWFTGPSIPPGFGAVELLQAAVEPLKTQDLAGFQQIASQCECCAAEHELVIAADSGEIEIPAWLTPLHTYANTVLYALCTTLRYRIAALPAAAGSAG